jgi:hypothetical protein
MSGSRTLSWKDGETITLDQELTYESGKGEYRCQADVTVVEVGRAGCTVRIDRMVSQGVKNTIRVGENVSAGWSELEMDT